MKRLRSMTIAQIKMAFRARQALFWNLAFPLILLTLMSLIFGRGSGFSVTVGVAGNGPLATSTERTLRGISGVTVKTGTATEEIEQLRKGNRDAVLVVPPGNPTAQRPLAVTMYYDQTNLSQSGAVVSLVSQVVTGINQSMSGTPQLLTLRQQGIAAASNSYIDYLAPGIIAVSIMTSAINGIAARLVGYREQRILKRLRATPLSAWEFIAANVLSQLVVVAAQVAVLTLAAKFIFGVRVSGNLGLLLGLAFLGALAFLTIGFALSGLAKSGDSAGAIANAVTTPMMFLSGVYFPLSGAPSWLKPVIGLLPLTYLANGLRDVMLHATTFDGLKTDLLALLITIAIGLTVAARAFRWE